LAVFIFFLCVLTVAYIYAGYPCIVFILSIIKSHPIRKGPHLPRVTILIAAFNEKKAIAQTIRNKLEQDYPRDRLEIIVISDGSFDGTDDIVRTFQSEGVKLVRQEPRAGKTSALNRVLPMATGDILFFSDANSIWAGNALLKLAENFKDPSVGYVTGKMIYTNPDGSPVGDGCTAYMKYENFLRLLESKIGSVVGVDGGIDAVRKELYQPMRPDQLPDFVLPLKVVEQGYRVVYEPEAILKEAALNSAEDEYRMRVRVSLRALWALFDMRRLLAVPPSRRPLLSPSPPLALPRSLLFSWQLWSHKVLRYLCFIFLIGAYVSNALLVQKGAFYLLLFILQTAFYAAAAFSPGLEKAGYQSRLTYFMYYFVLLNAASAHAFFKFLLGKKTVLWTPRKG